MTQARVTADNAAAFPPRGEYRPADHRSSRAAARSDDFRALGEYALACCVRPPSSPGSATATARPLRRRLDRRLRSVLREPELRAAAGSGSRRTASFPMAAGSACGSRTTTDTGRASRPSTAGGRAGRVDRAYRFYDGVWGHVRDFDPRGRRGFHGGPLLDGCPARGRPTCPGRSYRHGRGPRRRPRRRRRGRYDDEMTQRSSGGVKGSA
jgi:hypothetical protein